MDYTKQDCQIWFEKIKRELGIAPTAMAHRIGLTPSTINMPLRDGNDKVVSIKTLKTVADSLLSLTVEQPETEPTVRAILTEASSLFGFTVATDDIEMSANTPRQKSKPEIEPAEIDRTHMGEYQLDPRTIPVLGTAAGSAMGSFEIGSEPIDHVRRPPSLAGLKQIYAIYVVGESMVPEHNPGDLRIIHPDRPPQPGDSVVIQTYNAASDTREAFIKRLISINKHEIVCFQHNPNSQISYLRPNGNPELNDTEDTYVINIHKVLTMNELHGF